jgi:hypothetical protein
MGNIWDFAGQDASRKHKFRSGLTPKRRSHDSLAKEKFMRAHPVDRRIAELLNDPLTRLIIQADGVDSVRLAAQLRRVAERRSDGARIRNDAATPWGALGRLSPALIGVGAP